MARQDLTEIVVILDRSGSMSSRRDDVIGGFNSFLEEQQKAEGSAVMTVVLFDHEYEFYANGVDVQKIKPLTTATFVPRGSTALLDAIGRSINEVSARIESTAEPYRPSKVIVTVMTDGYENASREFRKDNVTKLIEGKRQNDWQVLFIGADEKSIGEAQSWGISHVRGAGGQSVSATMSVNWMESESVLGAYTAMNSAVSSYRTKGNVGNWTDTTDAKDKNETTTV